MLFFLSFYKAISRACFFTKLFSVLFLFIKPSYVPGPSVTAFFKLRLAFKLGFTN